MIEDTEALRIIYELELQGCKIDVVLPSGRHRYFSTHCRCGDHDACSATVLHDDAGNAVNRRPAQCKTCAAPCVCEHHA
jgi:hypothetical protein